MGKSAKEKEQCEIRIIQVSKWILEGWRTNEMQETGVQWWHVSKRAINRYIYEAKKLIADEVAKRRKEIGDITLAQIDLMYQKSNNKEDYRTCLEAIRERAKICGLYAPEKTEQSGKVEVVISNEDRNL